MDVKELRVGNLVKDDECIIVVVEALSGDNALVNGYGENEVLFSKKGYPNVLFESEIYPIELTEEMILKCGFTRKETSLVFVFQMPEFNATIQIWNGNEYASICRSGIAAYRFECKYLHQLQNIYFSLTGKELDVSRII